MIETSKYTIYETEDRLVTMSAPQRGIVEICYGKEPLLVLTLKAAEELSIALSRVTAQMRQL